MTANTKHVNSESTYPVELYFPLDPMQNTIGTRVFRWVYGFFRTGTTGTPSDVVGCLDWTPISSPSTQNTRRKTRGTLAPKAAGRHRAVTTRAATASAESLGEFGKANKTCPLQLHVSMCLPVLPVPRPMSRCKMPITPHPHTSFCIP